MKEPTSATLAADATSYTATVPIAFGGRGSAPVDYAFTVRAINAGAKSPGSNIATAATPPVTPPGSSTLNINSEGLFFSIPDGPLSGAEVETVPTGEADSRACTGTIHM